MRALRHVYGRVPGLWRVGWACIIMEPGKAEVGAKSDHNSTVATTGLLTWIADRPDVTSRPAA